MLMLFFLKQRDNQNRIEDNDYFSLGHRFSFNDFENILAVMRQVHISACFIIVNLKGFKTQPPKICCFGILIILS